MANRKGKVQVKAEVKKKKKFTPKMSSGKGGLLTAKLIASLEKQKGKK